MSGSIDIKCFYGDCYCSQRKTFGKFVVYFNDNSLIEICIYFSSQYSIPEGEKLQKLQCIITVLNIIDLYVASAD